MKYLKFAPYLILVILFFLWSGSVKDNKIKDSCISSLRQDSILLTADLKAQKDFTNKLQKAKTKIDTFYSFKIDSITKHYKYKVSYAGKKLSEALNKDADTTFIYCPVVDVQKLSDGFKKDDLTLDYDIFYKGEILDIDFDWEIKEKIVVKNHIIYEDVIVEKPVYLKSSYFYGAYSYAGNIHDFNIGYIHKNIGFNSGAIFFDKKLYPKIGIIFIIPTNKK